MRRASKISLKWRASRIAKTTTRGGSRSSRRGAGASASRSGMKGLIDAVGALLNRRDDVDLRALILDDDGALRVAIRGRRGAFLEAAVAAAASAARRLGEEALFARRLWPTNIVEVAGEAGKRALVGDGASKALRAMIDEGPLAESGEADVDAHARILGTLGSLGRRLLSAKIVTRAPSRTPSLRHSSARRTPPLYSRTMMWSWPGASCEARRRPSLLLESLEIGRRTWWTRGTAVWACYLTRSYQRLI